MRWSLVNRSLDSASEENRRTKSKEAPHLETSFREGSRSVKETLEVLQLIEESSVIELLDHSAATILLGASESCD
jgi:hypothetical protein